jgi:hydroxymethylpyrimidine/phosphomethylpyrimidine kinase
VSAAKPIPVALTIAGSDSGGGAGVQADLKTFTSLGVHGTTAITCLTAQNPVEVRGIQPCRPDMVRAQIEAVFEEVPPAAVKTGMLYSTAIQRVVTDWFITGKRPPLVVDPVMIASSGAALVKNAARSIHLERLLPLALLVTPNLDETGALLGVAPPRSIEEMRQAARQIQGRFGCAALVKGGHLRQVRQAVDIFFDGETELLLEAPFVRGVSTHGTGCTYSAAITAHLARGQSLARSVELAKEYITQAIAQSYRIGQHRALNCFWKSVPRQASERTL